MTEDNDKRGPPPAPPKEGSVKQMTEDNDKRYLTNPSKGGECLIDKDLLSKLIAYYLISFLIHYPICLSPPLEGLGEVFPFVLLRQLLGTPLLWRGRGRWGRLFVNNFPYTVFQHMVF